MAFTTPVMVPTSASTGPVNSAVRYAVPAASSNTTQWQSTAAVAGLPFPAGTISGLKVRLPAALTGGQTWAFTLNVNGTDTAITCTVDSSDLIASDSAHSVAINDGDLVCLKSAPSGTPTAQLNIQFSFLHVAAGSSGVLQSGTSGSAVSGTPAYSCIGRYTNNGATVANATGTMPCAGTISTMWFAVSVAPGTGKSRTLTLVKNGVDTALTVAISDAAKSASVTPGSAVSFAVGDTVYLRFDTTTTVSAVNTASFLWTPTNDREVPLLSSNAASISNSATSYAGLPGTSGLAETTESNTPAIVPAPMRLTSFRHDVAAPGSGKSRTATVRINSADSAAVALVNNALTNATWTGDIGLATNDLIDISNAPSGTPGTSGTVQYGAVVKMTATFNDTAAETVAGADALSTIATFPNTVSAALTASDAPTSAATFVSAFSEAVTAADVEAPNLVIAGSTSDSLTTNYSLVNAQTFVSTFSESVSGTSPSLATTVTFSNAIAEQLTAADAHTGVCTLPGSISEVLASGDALTLNLMIPVSIAEPVTTADGLIAGNTMVSAFTESATLLDSLSGGLTLTATFSEALSASYTVIGDVLVMARPNANILVQLNARLEISLPARQIITIVDEENTAILPSRISVGG